MYFNQKPYDKKEQKYSYKSTRDHSDYNTSRRLSREKDRVSNADYKKGNSSAKEKYSDEKSKRNETEKENKHSNYRER